MSNDSFAVEILEDGTIKLTTDKVGAANHANAEEFFKYVARMTGGESKRVRRADAPVAHTHTRGTEVHKQ